MGNNLVLKHKESGLIKEAKIGFSWVNLLFGFFNPLFKGDWKWAIIQLAAAFFTMGFSGLIFPFFYNKIYVTNLLEKGYVPADDKTELLLKRNNIL